MALRDVNLFGVDVTVRQDNKYTPNVPRKKPRGARYP